MRLVTAVLLAAAVPAAAQAPAPSPVATHRVVAGERYDAGPLHRLFLGPTYRKLWTTPIEVEVLDLGTFAGGLKPTKKGGGMQTKSLRFDAADGREFRVRSVDKDPSPTLPPDLRDTFAEWLVQDQISSSHPAGAIIVDGLAEAAGLRHVDHRFVIIPDDPRLGEFRKEFGGMLGLLEPSVSIKAPVTPGFEDVEKMAEGDEMDKLADASPQDRVDARMMLKWRLFDMFIGDWDRHIGQWDWIRVKGQDKWQPIATDRDQAFAKFDGLVLWAARTREPRFVNFEYDYPPAEGLGFNPRFVDRRYLAELDRPVYHEVAAELQRSLTDAAIEAAARRMPEPYYRLNGQSLVSKLKSRRDQLPKIADEFYETLADIVEVHGTNQADFAEIVRAGDTVEVRLRASADAAPYFQRTFRVDDTDEVRVHLKQGADRAVIRGDDARAIRVRVVGGAGADIIDDSAAGETRVYDHEGENRIVEGPGTHSSDAVYVHPVDRRKNPLRDFGDMTLPSPLITAGGDLGVLVGLNLDFYRFSFRQHPHASRQSLRAGYATGLKGFKFEYDGEWVHTNSRKMRRLFARVSDVEIVRFHGFGNETVADRESDFYKTPQRQFILNPSFRLGLDAPVDFSIGVIGKYVKPDIIPGRFLIRPYGDSDDFGQVGAGAALVVDGRNRRVAATRGAILSMAGTYYPKALDVQDPFTEAHGEMAAYLKFGPTLALRVGGKKLWGTFPYHEAAFIGGPDTVRGLRRQRYAGDASAFGNAELRLRLFDFKMLVPIDVTVFGLADGGRVWVDGEDSNRWHHGVGGGLGLTFLRPEYTFSIAGARGSDDNKMRLYFQGGYGF
jgi:hypothetical protein